MKIPYPYSAFPKQSVPVPVYGPQFDPEFFPYPYLYSIFKSNPYPSYLLTTKWKFSHPPYLLRLRTWYGCVDVDGIRLRTLDSGWTIKRPTLLLSHLLQLYKPTVVRPYCSQGEFASKPKQFCDAEIWWCKDTKLCELHNSLRAFVGYWKTYLFSHSSTFTATLPLKDSITVWAYCLANHTTVRESKDLNP